MNRLEAAIGQRREVLTKHQTKTDWRRQWCYWIQFWHIDNGTYYTCISVSKSYKNSDVSFMQLIIWSSFVTEMQPWFSQGKLSHWQSNVIPIFWQIINYRKTIHAYQQPSSIPHSYKLSKHTSACPGSVRFVGWLVNFLLLVSGSEEEEMAVYKYNYIQSAHINTKQTIT